MKNQQGAALVIVMALLAGAMTLGLSGMQTALVDERLASNYRASTQAQMTSENVLAALASDENKATRENYLEERLEKGSGVLKGSEIAELIKNGTLDELVNGLLPANYEDLEEEEKKALVEELQANLELEFEVDGQNNTITITSSDRGLRNDAFRDSSVVYRYNVDEASGAGFFSDGFITCYGAELNGGGGVAIDSFDSRKGAYGVGGNSGGKASLIALHENSDIVFNMGSTPGMTGDVFSAGGIEVTNTMPIAGSVYTAGKISLDGNSALITGDLFSEDSVLFKVGTRVDGNVSANKSIQVLGNWGEVRALQPNGSTRSGTTYAIGGDAISPDIYTQIDNRIEGSQASENPEVRFEDFLSEGLSVVRDNDECSDYGVEKVYEEFSFKSNPRDVDVVSNAGPVGTNMLGKPNVVGGFETFHVNRLRIGGNGLVVEEPTVIVADSDVSVELWGDDNAISLKDGATLRIISKGRVFLSGSNVFDMNGFSPVVDVEGELVPAFSFNTLYEGSDTAISMASDGDFYGELLAPFGNVNITGSARLMGRVFSHTIGLNGGGSMHYDRAYDDIDMSVGTSERQWCTFADISPLAIASPIDRLRLPSSRATFDGAGIVPDITVSSGNAEKVSSASTANGNVREGITSALFDREENAEKFSFFIDVLRNKADRVLNGVYKNNTSFGGVGDEKITFVNGDIDANNISGAGILVVNGDYNGGGNASFEGLMIVLGDYTQKGGGGRDLNGALLIAPYSRSSLQFTPANIEFIGGGNNDFNYDEGALRAAFGLLDESEQKSWADCALPTKPDDGSLSWSLVDWK
ncbi:MAG: pilus assembly PilX family protein [Pseudomonadota bacterium]